MNKRPYDIALSDDLRDAVRERRRFPDGAQRYPKIEERGNTEIYAYPWSEMKLGDFFFVPLRGQHPGKLQVRFRQVAARKDWELTIVQCLYGDQPSLRVCLTLLDVSEVKDKAKQHHGARGASRGDGRWKETRKARYRRTKAQANSGKPRLKVVSETITPMKQFPVEEDATLSASPDRAQLLRERLAALGIGAKS